MNSSTIEEAHDFLERSERRIPGFRWEAQPSQDRVVLQFIPEPGTAVTTFVAGQVLYTHPDPVALLAEGIGVIMRQALEEDD